MAHVLAFEAEFLFKMLLTGRHGWRCHRADTRRREGGSEWYSTEPTPVPPCHATALETSNHAPAHLASYRLCALPAQTARRIVSLNRVAPPCDGWRTYSHSRPSSCTRSRSALRPTA